MTMRRTEAMTIITRVLRQPVEGVPAADLIYGRALAHIEDPAPDGPKPWAMQVDMLALRIAAQLPLTDDTEQESPLARAEQESPLARAEDAKRARDLGRELGTLMEADHQLTSAPWHPVRPGDMVHIHYEQAGGTAAFGETYVIGDAGDGLLSMELVGHTLPGEQPAEGMVGCFAGVADDPLYEAWFEAGPHRLAIVRDGRVVHNGSAR
jgi:hypothetical protein